jgi:hypothetical protein
MNNKQAVFLSPLKRDQSTCLTLHIKNLSDFQDRTQCESMTLLVIPDKKIQKYDSV